MSQENVELAQAFNEAWNAGDMDAVREFYDPDVVVRPMKDWPERGPFFGREAVMQWLEQLRDTWDTLVVETVSRVDAGDRIIERHIPHGMGQGPSLCGRIHDDHDGSKGQGPLPGTLLGSRRSSRSRGPDGVGRCRRRGHDDSSSHSTNEMAGVAAPLGPSTRRGEGEVRAGA